MFVCPYLFPWFNCCPQLLCISAITLSYFDSFARAPTSITRRLNLYNKNRGYQTQALRVLTTGSALRTLPAHSAPPVIRHTTFSTLSLRANILNQILRPQEAPGFGEYDGGRARSMQRLPRTLLPPAQPGHRGMPSGCDSHVPGLAASRMPAGSTWPLRARRWASQNHAAAAPYAAPACSAWTPAGAAAMCLA